MRTTQLTRWAVAVFVMLGSVTSGCGGGGGKTTSSSGSLAPSRLYNTWRLTSASGGITGQGQPITEETTLTFRNNGTVERTQGSQKTTERYRVARTSTFFGGNAPVLEYLNANGDVNATPLVILSVDDKKLSLVEEATDGFGYGYERVP